jgi:hypothetical protein
VVLLLNSSSKSFHFVSKIVVFDLFTALFNFSDINIYSPPTRCCLDHCANLTIEQIDWNLIILMIYVLLRLDLLLGDYSLCTQNAWSQIILQAGLFELMR